MTVRETRSRAVRVMAAHRTSSFTIEVVLLSIVGAVLRWIGLQQHGLWLDEIGEAVTASLPLSQLLESVKSQAGAAPLDFLGVKAVTAILGSGTTSARLWAYAFGVLAIPLAYGAARRLSGSRLAGLAAAFLVTFSPFLILYSREARFYSLAVACTLAIMWSHARARSRPHRTGYWVVYAVTVAAGVLTYYYVALIAAALALADVVTVVRWRRRRRALAIARGDLLSFGVAAAVATPWLISALPLQLSRSFFWDVPPLTFGSWSDAATSLVLGSGVVDGAGVAAVVGVSLVALAGIVLRPRDQVVVLGLLAILVVPLVWMLAARSGYQVAARQAILLLPLLYVLAGYGFAAIATALRDTRAGRLLPAAGIACAIAWLAMMFGPLMSVMDRSGSATEDWPGATRFIATARCGGSEVFTNLGAGFDFGIGYYDPTLLSVSRVVEQRNEPFQVALGRAPLSRDDMVAILAYAGGTDSPNVRSLGALRTWFAAGGWTERSFGTQLHVYYRDTCAPPIAP